MTEAVAQFDDVTKVYRAFPWRRSVVALDRVSLKIPAGQVCGLAGPNRAGKSTLVKLLLSLCRPTTGRVRRLGYPADARHTLGQVGYMHESPCFPRYYSAAELLMCYGELGGTPRSVTQGRSRELLEQVGLADRRREPIAAFSKGMLQRLALAQALINEPRLLVLDEPSEGLDLLARRFIGEALQAHRRRGGSAIVVSHSAADLERWCDELIVLRAGRVACRRPVAPATSHCPSPDGADLESELEAIYAGGAT